VKFIYQGFGILALLSTTGALSAQQAYLKTSVDPGRAGVFVDGKYLGPAANFRIDRKYALTPGKHEVKLVDPRYEEFTTSVDLTVGKTTKLEQKLKPLPAAKGPFGAVRTPVGEKYDAVYVNSHYVGHADEFSNGSQKLLLPVGEYEIRVERASGAPVVQKVKVEEGKTVIVK